MVGVGHSIPLLKNSMISTRQPFAQGLADIEFVEERNIHIAQHSSDFIVRRDRGSG